MRGGSSIFLVGRMKAIEIPFTNFMKVKILQGNKTATSRNRKYGEEGDVFIISHRKFELVSVHQVKLVNVSRYYYLKEGFDTPEEFVAYWKDLHKGFNRVEFVWFHQFREIRK